MANCKTALHEQERLLLHHAKKANWKHWGPYLSERSWATVREDATPNGDIWNSCSYEEASRRVFRWGEDGIGGFSDRFGRVCVSFVFWNGKDPILKERFFGLTNPQGNHGEDVKELYHYLDGTPTHSYMKMAYKYPHGPFPYEKLLEENQKRSLQEPEYELADTAIFKEGRYFDITLEYAKESEEEWLARATVVNCGKEEALFHILPQIWLRNSWDLGYKKGPTGDDGAKQSLSCRNNHLQLDGSLFYFDGSPAFLFTENESGKKEAFHRYIIHGDKSHLNHHNEGTKACAHYSLHLKPKESAVFKFRLSKKERSDPLENFDAIFTARIEETDVFYASIQNPKLPKELKKIQRQAFAGLLWNKQLYYLDQEQWREGDPKRPIKREKPLNGDWDNFFAFDVISMPDKWEYPYFCAWDLSFHCLSFVLIDPDFAKRQLLLMTREWYMHPNGQLPAHEWNFSDVNPPVHAWAAWRVYKIDAKIFQKEDRPFLEGIFHKLLMNFTWWVNKEDIEGNNLFQGGFLGMDNISIFDRNRLLPTGGHIDQSDGSAWMAFYCITMMKISLHLAAKETIYQDIASKFFEHFMRIAHAMTNIGGQEIALWNEEDGFFYDVLHLDHTLIPLKVRSLVGLLPLLAVETIEPELLEKAPDFTRRMEWFISKRPDVSCNLACIHKEGEGGRRLLSIVTKEKLERILHYMLDEKEFLSPYGLRSLSRIHHEQPYTLQLGHTSYKIHYTPAESDDRTFGGNSNWRGPVWFPINFLIIEALQKFHHYFGDSFKVPFPTGSANYLNLWDISIELSKRLITLFLPDKEGKRPIYNKDDPFQDDLLFYEYFHGDTGKGLGASHHTGWTALIAKLIQQSGEYFS